MECARKWGMNKWNELFSPNHTVYFKYIDFQFEGGITHRAQKRQRRESAATSPHLYFAAY